MDIDVGPNERSTKIDLRDDAPRELSLVELAQSHAKEIRALTENIKNKGKSRPIKQSIPHFMRRRASSHNINRLPRRIRLKLQSQDIPPPKKKKPSRYHRRRPKNLLDEYTKRQKHKRWLETHIWHAKRFHMIEKWGFKLPDRPTEKSERASYRAAATQCVVQDQSYFCCTEIFGPKSLFYRTMKSILPAEVLTEEEYSLISEGRKLWECTIYKPDMYPFGCIGPSQIMYNSAMDADHDHVWLWCHPSIYEDLNSVLVEVFKENLGFSVKIVENLIRFSVYGPRTQETLARVLVPVSPSTSAVGEHVWWASNHADRSQEISHRLELLSPTIPFDGLIRSVTVRDPRLIMPAIQHPQSKDVLETWYKELGLSGGQFDEIVKVKRFKSSLWSEDVRATSSNNVMTQQEINSRRAQLLVPGSELALGDAENCVPAVVISYPNKATLILPAKWGMAFWTALVYSAARAGGLRDDHVINFENKSLNCPEDFPDTEACAKYEMDNALTLYEKHLRYPPNKRPNFDKLVINSPFHFNWKDILGSKSVHVLRDKAALEKLRDACVSLTADRIRQLELLQAESCLVRVSLSMVNRGVPEDRAEICLPTPTDITDLKSRSSPYGPTQPLYKGKPKLRDQLFNTNNGDRLSSARQIIGYIKMGRYSLSTGSAFGIGFVSITALLKIIDDEIFKYKTEKGIVGILCLVRSPSSTQYRYAVLNVLCD